MLLNTISSSGTLSDPSRIIHLSSMLNVRGSFDVTDPDFDLQNKPFNSTQQYSNSKLLLLHYNSELARRLQGSKCESVAVHPGKVNQNFPYRIRPKPSKTITMTFNFQG